MRTTNFTNGAYYHVYNRGVDKRNVFEDDLDKSRFLDKLDEYLLGRFGNKQTTVAAYCLMDNHFHLLLRQESNHGISETMRRLGSSHTHYFNNKQNRSGRLFEGPFKVKPVDNDGYLASLITYIHLNPLAKTSISTPGQIWSAIQYLERYPWSDCYKYLSNSGELSRVFDDISYTLFLRQSIKWRYSEPGSREPGSGVMESVFN